jgi:hypothetical protein
MKTIKFYLTSFLLIILAFLFSCSTTAKLKRMPDEPYICFMNRLCVVGAIEAKAKDFSGCVATYGITCKKKWIKEDCKSEDSTLFDKCVLYYN